LVDKERFMTLGDKRDELYAAIVVAALLIGTASGSAMIMLVLSALALSLGVIFLRPRMNGGPMRVMIVAAVTAIVVAIVTGFILR
jgi:hypothetical protein